MRAGGRLTRRPRGRCESCPNRHTQPPSSRQFRGRTCCALGLAQDRSVPPESAPDWHTNVLPLCADRSCQEISRSHPGKFAAPEEVCHSTRAHFRAGSNRPRFVCPARECDKRVAVQRGCPRLESSHTHLRFVAIELRLWNRAVQTCIFANRRSESHATTCVQEGGRSSSRRLACFRPRSAAWQRARAGSYSGPLQARSTDASY